jgi:hypothetical protein
MPDRVHFAVRGGIVELTAAVAPARKDAAITYDHRPVQKIRWRASSIAIRMNVSSVAASGGAASGQRGDASRAAAALASVTNMDRRLCGKSQQRGHFESMVIGIVSGVMGRGAAYGNASTFEERLESARLGHLGIRSHPAEC